MKATYIVTVDDLQSYEAGQSIIEDSFLLRHFEPPYVSVVDEDALRHVIECYVDNLCNDQPLSEDQIEVLREIASRGRPL